jgi:16S rRNA (uracil1498-N3)-methyltransferase
VSLPVHWVPSLAGVRAGDTVGVEGDEAHHAVAVRRLRAGEAVVLTDGAGTTVTGTVGATGRRELIVTAVEVHTVPPPDPALTVVQALPKGDRGELAVEVLTEIGVATIVPWSASRSVTMWKGDRAARSSTRWRSTAREAAKQSRRAWFPEVTGLATTIDVLPVLAAADLAVVLHEEATTPLSSLDVPATGTIVVVVGPEGGLGDEEVAAFTGAGAVAVRLGGEVLRTSTAGVAACAALLARTGRWGSAESGGRPGGG